MKPQKYPYWEWEDYHAGLYRLGWVGTQSDAARLLANASTLERAMVLAVETWPKASAHHLTDDAVNGRAWLGWAACGIWHQVPAHLTRAAWWTISESERDAANAAADRVIAGFLRTVSNAEALPF